MPRHAQLIVVSTMLLLHAVTLRAQAPRVRTELLPPAGRVSATMVEGESLLRSATPTHGKVGRQDMRPFGPGWSGDGQLFWGVAQLGAQLRLTFTTAAAGRHQVFLHFTRAPDFALVRASFDGAPTVSFNGYAPTVSRDRALLGMRDLTPGVHELLLEVAMKDGKSTGLNVGLDRIELAPVAGRTEATQPKLARPQLAFARLAPQGPDGPPVGLGPLEKNVYRPNLTVVLAWEAVGETLPPYRWQVVSQPFQRGAASSSPPGLLADGPATPGSFKIPLGSFPPLGTGPLSAGGGQNTVVAVGQIAVNPASSASSRASAGSRGTMTRAAAETHQRERPLNLYIRIVPIVEGKVVGPPSNTIVAHYLPGPDPVAGKNLDDVRDAMAAEAERKKNLELMRQQAKVHQIAIVDFKPMILEDPNRWGCVFVIQNPYAGIPGHRLQFYPAGQEYCGKSYKGQGYQAENVWDVIAGWAKAYDILATFYDDAKSWVADQIAELAPCEAMGDKIEGGCEAFVQQAASGAMSAGLVAAGVPPTLPNLGELQGAAEGKVVEVAVDYTCKEFEARGGGQCTPEMRKALATAYQKGIDKIQIGIVKASKEPGCGDVQAAHDHGREPLPCFTDGHYPGTNVRPATGAVTEPASVTLRVARVKPNPPFAMPACRLSVDLTLKNHFSGGYLHGVNYGPSDLQGNPFLPAEAAVPPLAVGKAMQVTLVFNRYRPFAVPGHYNPTIWWDDWLHLYVGGMGPLSAKLETTTPVPGAKTLGGSDIILACAESAHTMVQIPH